MSARVLEPSPINTGEEVEAYDALVRRHAWLMDRPFVKLLSRIGLERGRILDIGTGPGWVPIALAGARPHWEIWAVDASEDMLARARHHARAAGVAERIRFVHGNATDLPFARGTFDLVISQRLLHHIARPEEMLDEVARVARNGGKVVIKDLLRQPRWQAALLLAFSRYVLRSDPRQLQQYRESLTAALTIAEVRAALKKSRLRMARIRRFRGVDFVIAT
jgi:ubiquinone/menaquinone biosynthesis C-methylase UbiE